MTSGSETGRFTVRRLRSAVSLWRASIRGSDVLVAAALAVLSLGLSVYLLARSQAPAHLAFAQRAQLLQASITERLLLPREDLETLRSFFETSGRVTRRQFQAMTHPMLLRHRIVSALEWLPLVRGPERFFHEAEARAAGLTAYRIWESGPDGRPLPAGARPFFVPIQYMEPPSSLALGFDIASEPGRWHIAEAARDSGKTVASRPFVLLEDAGRADASPAIALYAPVYLDGDPGTEEGRRATLTGFAMAIFRVAPLAQEAAAAANASGLGFALSDGRGGPPMVERPRPLASLPRRSGFRLDFPLRCADRTWTLDVVPLPGAFLPSRRPAAAVAAIGTLAALLGLITVTSLRTISRLRRQAEKVGPYRLIARLGNGAMGVVWEARHALLRRPTAIKLLAPGTEGEKSLARFEREVQLTAGLTHPSTIAIYDYGRTPDGVFYYAMELLRGINLQQLVDFGGPLPAGRVVHLLRQACGALSEAHAAGLIHRDIKPANLMICHYGGMPDFLKILDFGLVKDVGAVEERSEAEVSEPGADAGLSQDGSLLGTPLYMAPEGMSDPTKVDARADLFGLGAVGYFLLTGSSPFPGRTAIEIFKRERLGPPAALSGAASHPVPPALEETLRRCLSFERDERPASADALDAMLEPCAAATGWKAEQARAWWRDRGPAALAAVRAKREEAAQIMFLSSDSRFRG